METLLLVTCFFKLLLSNTLELEWKLFKAVQIDEGVIPNSSRELVGAGIAAIITCQHCIEDRAGVARLNGATDAEIEDAVHFAKSSAGWSTSLNGMQVGREQFIEELRQVASSINVQAVATPA